VISATQPGNSTYDAAATVTQTIAIGRRNQSLAFTSSTNAITSKTFGDSAFVVAAASSDSAAVLLYSLGTGTTNNACSVSTSGLVTVLAVGLCEIDADSLATTEVAAASTITKTIQIRSDYAAAPFIGSVSTGNLSATLGFFAPSYTGGSPITAYEVTAINQDSGSSQVLTESSCPTVAVNGLISCTISGLSLGSDYRFRVAAINAAGTGALSDLSGIFRIASNPSAVQGLSVVEGNGSLFIQWSDPDTLGGGTFEEYRIFIKKSADSVYDQNNFFRVRNAATRSVTLTRESPPDGMSFLGGPLLVNGTAYDVKVVTVTVANAAEFEANTAQVNQIPHTVPDAPQVATSLVLGSNLVITWTAPASDGGASITGYAVTFQGVVCSLANATDTQCLTSMPTTPGTYSFEVRAINAAGQSAPISGSFQVAVQPSPAMSNPATPGATAAPIIMSVSTSSDGTLTRIIGTNFTKVRKVYVGDALAKILSSSASLIEVESKPLTEGSYDLYIHFADGTVLKSDTMVTIGEDSGPNSQSSELRLKGFAPGRSSVSAINRANLVAFLESHSFKSVQCVGSTQGPRILKQDARVAMNRARAVCAIAKQLGYKVSKVSYVNQTKMGPQFRSAKIILIR
jgi:hypothetical protein